MPGPLKNASHERFAQELAKGSTADAAYAAAGYRPHDSNPSRLSGNERVQARVTELKARIAEKMAEKTAVDAAWLLNRLAEESTADVADLYNEDGSLKPVREWPLIWRQGLVAGLDVEELREEGRAIGVIRKLKLSDRIKRLELIGKHIDVQAFRERVEVSGGMTITVLPEDAGL